MQIPSFQVQLILVFFVYGLAFFSMGLVMLMESGRSPLLAEARVLRPLAIFGIVHGIHEWLEMVLLISAWWNIRLPVDLSWLRLGLLTLSFVSLIAFSLRVLRPHRKISQVDIGIGAGFVAVYLILIAGISIFHASNWQNWMEYADAMSRYALAIPGALMACLALNRQAQNVEQRIRSNLGGKLRWAAWSFGLYSLTQAFVPALDIFPARYMNATVFLNFTGIPIQAVRAVLAVSIMVSLMRATQIAEDERQRQFLDIQKDRLEALESLRVELLEREAMRRELLKHTVLAQEDERARIARELHDETAQLLTAFALNLATLAGMLPKSRQASELIDRLQSLNRQMSQGIYQMVHDLRPAQLDDLGLVPALQYLIDEERQRFGLQIELRVSGSLQRLDPLIETVFFRVAQEALTNIARHARVRNAQIDLDFLTAELILRVCDQGIGFDPEQNLVPPKGWGLAGMRERTESIGGQFNLRSAPGTGTVVEIVVPLRTSLDLARMEKQYG